MIKTIYFVFFICAFALGLWACTGKEQEKFKSLSTAHFEQLIKDNKIIAGHSAKREASKIMAIRRAVFVVPGHAEEVRLSLIHI